MKKIIKTVFYPFYCLLFRLLQFRHLRNFYYCVFKYQSYKLLLANDFTTKNEEGVQVQYYHRKNVNFPHPVGVVIGRQVRLGMDCKIHQNVTIGGTVGKDGQPTLGDNVMVYANAVIVGPIAIGSNVIVAANSVVTQSVPDNCIVAGIPAKVVKYLDKSESKKSGV
ncbi:serine acetyltransferase [Vibrio parahaemolyticus]|uniref:serine O-acetyltransferase n=1 Tax=Vibrio parahaemolyticus TaxID=670 RepID=UPI00111CAC90|nr:serine acetyltransferase [Vibrio parahaemolyticus]EHH2531838.1 serine acetyltransferase [Vibrio parahaemolyticus]MBE3957378.1 serine acetyltransferase [Vibrio parahaemolyticus]MBE3965983.1 serine acetyltransferase [Vibrio parahaemolyticus]MBE3997075.1 serine acetyltransferase [Vibrio parahaemolyticus]MBE4014521.1 serine acetyltransferase [Vibrio parahaemolyticus]